MRQASCVGRKGFITGPEDIGSGVGLGLACMGRGMGAGAGAGTAAPAAGARGVVDVGGIGIVVDSGAVVDSLVLHSTQKEVPKASIWFLPLPLLL